MEKERRRPAGRLDKVYIDVLLFFFLFSVVKCMKHLTYLCASSFLCSRRAFHSSESAHLGVSFGGSFSDFSPCLAFVLFHRLFTELSAFWYLLSSLKKREIRSYDHSNDNEFSLQNKIV